MLEHDDFLLGIVNWAESRPDIDSLILTGSRAQPEGAVDTYSDHDLEIFTSNPERYTSNSDWMTELGNVWVYLPTTSERGCDTRLVIFKGGRKVDFSIEPVTSLENAVRSQEPNELYDRGFRVLLDKKGLASRLPAPSYAPPTRPAPTEAEFQATVEEFWFEAWHIPKYLQRDDLWVVKFRDWTMKELLLRVLEWHASASGSEPQDIGQIGIRMRGWLRPDLWRRLREVFGRFDAADSRRALLATTSLFRDVAMETAESLGFSYPRAVDDAISGYIRECMGPVD